VLRVIEIAVQDDLFAAAAENVNGGDAVADPLQFNPMPRRGRSAQLDGGLQRDDAAGANDRRGGR
jgi:hypothetical protein